MYLLCVWLGEVKGFAGPLSVGSGDAMVTTLGSDSMRTFRRMCHCCFQKLYTFYSRCISRVRSRRVMRSAVV